MKKLLLFIICVLPACSSLFSQHAPTHAPVNPDFGRFLKSANTDTLPQPDRYAIGNGAMPPPVQYNFDAYFHKSRLKTGNLPAVYDLRNTSFLTPVKGQTNNACWAFAAMAAVESQWLKLGVTACDLSENNLKYCHGFVPSRNEYGNHFMATAYFARRQGPLSEADDPNSTSSTCPGDKTPLAYITDARYLPNDMDAIKQAIMEHGAIFSMMYFVSNPDSLYYNATDYTYYYAGSRNVNHVVNLVGWDDNKVTAGGTGAWICRNSYGPGWGDSGYFYISYNNRSFLDYNAYWPTRMDYEPDAQVYGYDELGNWSSTGWGGHSGFMLVKFTASRNQLISKVATYAIAAGTTLGIDVYDHFDPGTGKLSGLRTHQPGLTCDLPGYYTFSLDKLVAVNAGSDFYIRIYYQTPAEDNPVPIEEAFTGYSAPSIETNKAWIGYDSNGESNYWFAIGGNTDYAWDPCIKAYAEPLLTWTGNQGTDWNTAANWSPVMVPLATHHVTIPATASAPLISNAMAAPATCKSLTVEAGAMLRLAPGKALTVYGDLTNYAGAGGLVTENGASLITLGAVNGQATILQTISGNRWHFISPPVSGALAGIFTSQYLQQHTEATNAYTYITDVNDALNAMKGYSFWGLGPEFTAQYIGYPNTGAQYMPLSRTAEGSTYGWNLAGNPYPSAIDWDAATGWTRNNIGPAIYIESNGDWATYLGGSGEAEGVGVNGGSRYIAPGQGFFVNVPATGNALLGTTDAVRTHNTVPLLKQGSNARLARLFVSGNGFTDEAVVRFVNGATAGFDASYDARKLFGMNTKSAQLYIPGDDKLVINSLPPGSGEAMLGLYARSSGIYTLAASSPEAEVVLEDIKTGQYTSLTKQTYSFAMEAGDEQQRFRLYFGTQALPQAATTGIQVYAKDKTLYVQLSDNQCGEISVSNMAGQCVARTRACSPLSQVKPGQPGIYIVKVITERQTVVQKIFVN